eukprot:4236246-Amphidinium_carterae.1
MLHEYPKTRKKCPTKSETLEEAPDVLARHLPQSERKAAIQLESGGECMESISLPHGILRKSGHVPVKAIPVLVCTTDGFVEHLSAWLRVDV